MLSPEKKLHHATSEQERGDFTEEVYHAALAEHPEFKNVPADEMKGLIRAAAAEIEVFEDSADRSKALIALTPEIADRISALWVFSGAGTYDKPEMTPPAYQQHPWTWGMDRDRLNYAAFLVRKIAEVGKSESSQRIPKGEIISEEYRQRTRKVIGEHGPTIIYNGTDIQNERVRAVLDRPETVIPKDNVDILGNGLRNTLDQIKAFALPEALHRPGKEIGIISHAPHLMRIMRMINRYKPLPEDMDIRLFPIATDPERKKEFTMMEIKGLLYYTFLLKDPAAATESYPYIVHGGGVDKEQGAE